MCSHPHELHLLPVRPLCRKTRGTGRKRSLRPAAPQGHSPGESSAPEIHRGYWRWCFSGSTLLSEWNYNSSICRYDHNCQWAEAQCVRRGHPRYCPYSETQFHLDIRFSRRDRAATRQRLLLGQVGRRSVGHWFMGLLCDGPPSEPNTKKLKRSPVSHQIRPTMNKKQNKYVIINLNQPNLVP